MLKTDCPGDETLAAFVDGRLGEEDRRPVADHIAGCAECRDVILTAGDLAREAGGEVVPMRRSWFGPAAALAAAAALAIVLFGTPIGASLFARWRVNQLADATADLKERPIAGRPSIDIAYKEHRPTRGEGDPETLAQVRLLGAAAKIEAAAQKNPTAQNLHHLGLAYLLLGPEHRDAAVRYLEEALKAETGMTDAAASSNADLLNDLAAAYFESGNAKAEATIARAWQLKKSPAIAWTRATILDTKAAWNDYLAIDATSEWAAEARRFAQSGS